MDANELLSTLRENPKNPRTITPDDFEKLKFKIRNFPQMLEKRPIAYDSSDNYITLGGNRRLNALQDLVKEGFAIKPEYFTDCAGWTPDQKRTFVILDNVSDGDWNYELLANEWTDLPLEEWGLDPTEWEKEKKEVKEDEPPAVNETEPAISQLGEVYQLGRHKLMCGDATKIEDVEKLMQGQKADMVFTDPPYGVDRGGGFGGFGGFGKPIARRNYNNDEWDKDRIAKEAFDNMFTFSEKLIIFGGNFYTDYLPVSGHWIVWDKKQTMPTFGDCELAWTNSDRKSIKKYEVEYNGLLGKEPERHHPTQKPLKLCIPIINDYSEENNAILDIFGGSGSTLIACEQTSRTCYMMELDPKYCDVIRKRYAKFIGRENDWQDIK